VNIVKEIREGKKFFFFDAAMGTSLQQRGMKAGEIPEESNFTHPEIILQIHRENIAAGANILTTNTFGANELKLQSSQYSVEQIVEQAISLARKAAEPETLVALDLGPTGFLLEPMGTLTFEQAYDLYKRQVIAGSEAGADLIIFETISDLYEVKAAILAAKENSTLPVFCTMTFQADGRTLTGTDPLTMVSVLEGLGVDVLGVNCSLGPAEVLPIVEEILKFATIPVMVQPNAGLPEIIEGETVFTLTPEEFARDMKILATKGVRVFGGCCGTTPTFIKTLIDTLQGMTPLILHNPPLTTVCSSTQTVILGKEVKIIGERINPTGNSKVKEGLRTQKFGPILTEAINQKEAGADILDVNIGIPEIDETQTIIKVVKELQGFIDLPLQIDSPKAEVLAAAARVCNGKPILNSVSGKQAHMDKIFPIAKKYGACVIGLTMDESGLPKTVEKRVEIAEKLIRTAQKYGIPKENIIIDCLTLTVSTHQQAALDSLRAMQQIKQQFGVKTTLGASNISFGLPHREIINQTYLAMAFAYGLDAPITDPTSFAVRNTVSAFKVLANHDPSAENYIERFGNLPELDLHHQSSTATSSNSNNPKQPSGNGLKDLIIKGFLEQAQTQTHTLLDSHAPLEIVDQFLIPALDIVGEKYDSGEIFLPQLIRSAETVKAAFAVIKEQMTGDQAGDIQKGKILLATVAGDVHDIGKNIIKILLENYGFEVIDLGKDVPVATVVETAQKHQIALIGLSALMTTTVENMKKTIEALRKSGLECKIMVGGAVLNEKYATMINADYYGKDAREAVAIAQKFFKV